MPKRTVKMTDKLYDYLLNASVKEGDVFKRLRKETAKLPFPGMQISPDQGQFFAYSLSYVFKRLRKETAKLPFPGMQISPDQGQFFASPSTMCCGMAIRKAYRRVN